MEGDKIETFMKLAGQLARRDDFSVEDAKKRELGAQLLLSEVLEYVIHGLGVTPSFNGTPITEPNQLAYQSDSEPAPKEMVDGLADVAYTMYWNALAFGIPLERAFELVCDNNLEKFVRLGDWRGTPGSLPKEEWHCGCAVEWPEEVASVTVLKIEGVDYAVGKDARGKVRKPSTYRPVDLSPLLPAAA